MAVYICSKCGAVVEKDTKPNLSGCSNGLHNWSRVSDGSLQPKPGLKPYQCKKCQVIIYAKSNPVSTGCPTGGLHQWIQL